MNIENWSSEGLDWSSVDALRGKQLYPYCEAIRLAIRERFLALGIPCDSYFDEDFDLSNCELRPFLSSVKYYSNYIVPFFLNPDMPVLETVENRKADGEYYKGNYNYRSSVLQQLTVSEAKQFGFRNDGTLKGQGYFGELMRYDTPGAFSTEIQIEVDGAEIPALVPTLTDNEVKWLLSNEGVTDAIASKAAAYAESRIDEKKSPFAEDGEQCPRSWMPTFINPLVSPRFLLFQCYQVLNMLNTHNCTRYTLSSKNVLNRYYYIDESGVRPGSGTQNLPDNTWYDWLIYAENSINCNGNPVAFNNAYYYITSDTTFSFSPNTVSRSMLAYLANYSKYDSWYEWSFFPDVFPGVTYPGRWKHDISIPIAADEDKDLTLNLLTAPSSIYPPHEDIYIRAIWPHPDTNILDVKWEHSARCSITSFIEKFDFAFQD